MTIVRVRLLFSLTLLFDESYLRVITDCRVEVTCHFEIASQKFLVGFVIV